MKIIAVENQEVCGLMAVDCRCAALLGQQRHLTEEVALREPDLAGRASTSTVPLATRYIASPGSPFRMMTVPACTVRALRIPTRSDIEAASRRANNGTCATMAKVTTKSLRRISS